MGSKPTSIWTDQFINWCRQQIYIEATSGMARLNAIPDPACRYVADFAEHELATTEDIEAFLEFKLARRLQHCGLEVQTRRDELWAEAVMKRFESFVRRSLDRLALDLEEARRRAALKRAKPKSVIQEIKRLTCWKWERWNPGILIHRLPKGQLLFETYLSAENPWFSYWNRLSGPSVREIRTSFAGALGVVDATAWTESEAGSELQIAEFAAEQIVNLRDEFESWDESIS